MSKFFYDGPFDPENVKKKTLRPGGLAAQWSHVTHAKAGKISPKKMPPLDFDPMMAWFVYDSRKLQDQILTNLVGPKLAKKLKRKPVKAFRVVAADCCAPKKNGDNCYPCAVIDVENTKALIYQVSDDLVTHHGVAPHEAEKYGRAALESLGIIRKRRAKK